MGLRNAMNEVVRGAYIKDCELGLKRWNMEIKRAGHDFQLKLPSTRFRRSIGAWANVPTDPGGPDHRRARSSRAACAEWLPTEADRAFVAQPDAARGRAGQDGGWIAPPDRGINNLPVDYEYVRLS